MGGLARRVIYTKTFQAKFKDLPTLLVDSGYFLADERHTHNDLRADAVIKNEWALKAYDQFPVDAANLSARDLKFLARALAKPEWARRQSEQPILRRLVSANVIIESADLAAPQKFLVREVADRKQASKKIRVAFVGLAEMDPAVPRGFKITDPAAAAARAVPEARKVSDVVIVLAHLKADAAARVAREVPGIDAIIVGNGEIFTVPQQVGQTKIVFTPFETRTLGELRFYRDAQGAFTSKGRFISLFGEEKDAAAAQMIAAASEAETGRREAARKLLNEWMASTRMGARRPAGQNGAGESGPTFISSSACAQCHLEQYMKWSNSDHRRSGDALVFKEFEFEASCLACHASGFAGGKFDAGQLPKFNNVQCEQCHGPGSDHAAKPAKGYGRIPNIKANCAGCHTPEASPNFDFQAYWEKIKH